MDEGDGRTGESTLICSSSGKFQRVPTWTKKSELPITVRRPRPRSPCFAHCFVGAKMFMPAGLKIEKPARPGTHLRAATSGYGGFARSRESNALPVRTRDFCPLPMM